MAMMFAGMKPVPGMRQPTSFAPTPFMPAATATQAAGLGSGIFPPSAGGLSALAPQQQPGRPKVGQVLSDFVLNYAAGMGNPIGLANLQERAQHRQAQQQEASWQQRFRQQQEAERAQWIARQDYERANPSPVAPSTLEREHQYIRDTMGPEAADRYLRAKSNPIDWISATDPDTGERRLIPTQRGGGSPSGAPQAAPPGVTFTPLPAGGAVPGGPRPFR